MWKASGGSSACRQTDRINRRWDGTTRRNYSSTSPRKVPALIWVLWVSGDEHPVWAGLLRNVHTCRDMHVTASQEIDTVSLEFKYAADTDRIMIQSWWFLCSRVFLKNVFWGLNICLIRCTVECGDWSLSKLSAASSLWNLSSSSALLWVYCSFGCGRVELHNFLNQQFR